jgi:hypothetical protein
LIGENVSFISDLFKSILSEMSSKEDQKATQADGGKLDKLKQMMMKLMAARKSGNKSNTDQNAAAKLSNLSSMSRGARYFNVFYQIFKYYGLDIFKVEFLPVIKQHISNGFKDTEYPHVCKAFLVDVLSAALRTAKYYYEDNQE